MLVHYSQAKALLEELADGVPGFEKAKHKLTKKDGDLAELTIEDDPHASPHAFARAAGIVEAQPDQVKFKCIRDPEIIGYPNVGQIVTGSAGVWEEPEVPAGVSYDQPRMPTHQLRWLFDGDEETPAYQREDNGHGPDSYTIPPEALGHTLVLWITKGGTSVKSKPFGPIKEGLNEYPYTDAAPVLDTDIVRAESQKTIAKESASTRRSNAARRTAAKKTTSSKSRSSATKKKTTG